MCTHLKMHALKWSNGIRTHKKPLKCIYQGIIIQNVYRNVFLLCQAYKPNFIAATPSIKLHHSKFYTLLKGNNNVKGKQILWSFHIWPQMLCHFQGKYLPAFLLTCSDSSWARHTAVSLNKIPCLIECLTLRIELLRQARTCSSQKQY